MTLAQLEPQLAELSRTEKAELMRRLLGEVLNFWPGVEKTPGVVGGDACIVRTRIPVWALESYRRSGWSDAAVLENYPTLRAVDLVNAWAYADAHRVEVERAMRENEKA